MIKHDTLFLDKYERWIVKCVLDMNDCMEHTVYSVQFQPPTPSPIALYIILFNILDNDINGTANANISITRHLIIFHTLTTFKEPRISHE